MKKCQQALYLGTLLQHLHLYLLILLRIGQFAYFRWGVSCVLRDVHDATHPARDKPEARDWRPEEEDGEDGDMVTV